MHGKRPGCPTYSMKLQDNVKLFTDNCILNRINVKENLYLGMYLYFMHK